MYGDVILTFPLPILPSSLIIHGTGRPNKMSKIFDPIEDDTAMSPSPMRATAIEETASGMEVPAARMVKPRTIAALGSPRKMTSPRISTHHTSTKENIAIQHNESKNVTMNHFLVGSG